MSENTNNAAANTNTDKPKDSMYKAAADAMKAAGDTFKAKAESASGITPEAILERIDKIIADKTHIEDAVRILNGVTENSAGMGTLPHGMSVIVEEREKTNREMIALLRDMHNGFGQKDNDPDVRKLDKLAEILGKANLPEEYVTTIIQTAAQQMFAKPATGDIHNY